MATQTSNLGLTKPGYDEAADIVPAVNNNMNTLDSKIGAVPANSSVQGQLDSHNQAIGNLANLTTTEKSSLVGAANELNSKIENIFSYGNIKKYIFNIPDQTVTANSVSDVDISSLNIPTTYIPFSFVLLDSIGDGTVYPLNSCRTSNNEYSSVRLANAFVSDKRVSGTLYLYFIEPT